MTIHNYHTALVTGAANGIGAASVRMLSKAGLSVLSIDKDADALSNLKDETGCEVMVLDLRKTDQIYDRLSSYQCDVLINNAGLAHDLSAGFLGATHEQVDDMLTVNVSAAVHVIRALLPSMIKRKSGHVVEMGSIASLYALGLPVYSATKGAIHSLSRALRIELNGTKIRHTEICPGRTSTSFFQNAFPDEKARSSFVDQIKNLDPEDIAAAISFALNAPLHVNVSMIELTPVDQAPGARVLSK
ncbi:MAG: SDR family oxidoreductase [Planktomarina sp.]|jgi:NADP-dependent 3-hydroxy acid dehydrogenase YdfG|nr:SDR family oxidoreductase [Planktomarina sp.]